VVAVGIAAQALEGLTHDKGLPQADGSFDDERLILLELDSMVDEFADR
jgi:hypothetical protein